MRTYVSSLLCGLVFGLGLAVSGMVYPAKVLGFLDVAGDWDATLLFVLGGAVSLTLVSFRFILRRSAPLLDDHFSLPTRKAVTPQLVWGAALFGVGWGISGYCPGPAIAALAAPGKECLIFLPAVLLGNWLQRKFSAPG